MREAVRREVAGQEAQHQQAQHDAATYAGPVSLQLPQREYGQDLLLRISDRGTPMAEMMYRFGWI